MLVDQRRIGTGVAQPGHELLRGGAGASSERAGRMAQVVKAESIESRLLGSRQPDAPAEVIPVDRFAFDGGEDIGVVSLGHKTPKVVTERLDNGFGKCDGPFAGLGLGRALDDLPRVQLLALAADVDRSVAEVDVAPAKGQ